MKYELPTHVGVILEDPEIIVASTLDLPTEEKFQPAIIVVVEPNIRLHYELPKQPYVNGSWMDSDVLDAIAAHLSTLEIQ
jgi:hypothetical protein